MIKLKTATGKEFTVRWAAPSSIDGIFRAEVIGATMGELFNTFYNKPEETGSLTRVFDESETVFTGYTHCLGFQESNTGSGGFVVSMKKEE